MPRGSRPPRDVLLQDFEANGAAFLKRLRDQFPLEYVRTITRIAPTESASETTASGIRNWTPEERATAYQKAKEVLDNQPDHLEALLDLRLIVTGFAWGVGIR